MTPERQNEIKRAAQKLNIPEIMLKGIVIPEDQSIEAFLLTYSQAIIAARGEQTRPVTVPAPTEGNAAEKQFAENLLQQWGLNENAAVGDTSIQ